MNPDLKALLLQFSLALVQSLLPVLGTLIGSLASYLLYELIGKIKNDKLKVEVQMAVAYAEQKFVSNNDRLTYVQNWLKHKTGGKLDDATLNHFIENAVVALQQNQVPSPNVKS